MIAENNRNTEIRRKMSNVGRPQDNVKDETSKLTKQGEIKKIIDEELVNEATPEYIKKTLGDLAKKHPLGKVPFKSMTINKDGTKTIVHGHHDTEGNRHVTKTTNEEVVDEAAQDQQTDGAFMKDKDKGDKDNKKKPDAQDEDDPRKITGGKTEVDLKPTTDDSTEDSTKEDETSKKAKAKVNKEIGAKGVKEHTMTGLHFGLPQGLIDTVRNVVEAKKIDEKLVGNQHKIDANKNGKIDAHDFKLLKGKKKVEEEAEDLGEMSATYKKMKMYNKKKMKEETEELDEVSDKTMSSYITKASASTTDKSLPDNKVRNRYAGVALADKKMEKMRKEETDPGFSEAELARLEEISKGL